MKLSVLALALSTSLGIALARADEPVEGGGAIYALVPDSTAAPSGPASSSSDPPPGATSSAASAATSDAAPSSLTPASPATAGGGAQAAPSSQTAPSATTAPAATTPASSAPKPGVTRAKTKAKTKAKPVPSKPAPAKDAAAEPAPAKPKPTPVAPGTNQTKIDEGTRVRADIERTEAILRSVRAKVLKSFNKKAREEFEKAAAAQHDAREALTQNLYARAERLTQEARTQAREIAVHLGPPQDDPDYVGMALDRTDDAIGRAREVLSEAGGTEEGDRLSALEKRQKEARRLQKDGATRDAYAATRDVRDGVLTLLRDCDDLPVPEATAEKALKRATRALEEAKGELGERLTTAAEKLARDARVQMEKARVAYARKNYRDTLLYSKLVERDLELAVSAQRTATSRTG